MYIHVLKNVKCKMCYFKIHYFCSILKIKRLLMGFFNAH